MQKSYTENLYAHFVLNINSHASINRTFPFKTLDIKMARASHIHWNVTNFQMNDATLKQSILLYLKSTSKTLKSISMFKKYE